MTRKHFPDDDSREKVRSHASVGLSQEDIGRVLGIDSKTLRRHYREELDTAAMQANAAVAGALYTKATNGDTVAMIFWLKTRMQWSEHKGKPDDEAPKPVTSITYVSVDASLPE